jgi:hypothetical protein
MALQRESEQEWQKFLATGRPGDDPSGFLQRIGSSFTRLAALGLREAGEDAYPLVEEFSDVSVPPGSAADKSDALDVVLRALPVPSDATSWESILEFRGDADASDAWLDLRNWINEVSTGTLTPAELQDKIE